MTKHKHRWTSEEEQALYAGVDEYGTGKWKEILKDPRFSAILVDRSNVDLKDKWRNLHAGLNGSRSRGKVKTLTTRETTNPRLAYPVPLAVISPIEYGGGSHIEHGGSSLVEYGGSPHIEHGGRLHIEHGGHLHIEHGGSPHIEHGGSPHIEHGGRLHIKHGGSSHIEYGGGSLIKDGGSLHNEHGGSPHTEHGGRLHIKHGGRLHIKHGGSSHTEYGGGSLIKYGGSPHIKHGGSSYMHGGRLHIEHGGRPHIEHGGSSANKKPPPTYGKMIIEALSSIEDPNGLDLDAICYSIEEKYELPANFRRSVTSKLRRLLLSGVLEKVDDCYKFKDDHNKEDAEPAGAETVEEYTARLVAKAENLELAAIKAFEKADKLAELLEESIVKLQAAEEIYEECKRKGYVLFAS